MAKRIRLEESSKEAQVLRLPTGQGIQDIWREIFSYLKDPLDFHNLLVASPDYFEPLMEDRKCAVLLPLVLQVLDRRDYITKAQTLETRLISKFTKVAVSNWIREDNPCFTNFNGIDHDIWDERHTQWIQCWNYGRSRTWRHFIEKVKSGEFIPGKCTLFHDGRLSIDISPSFSGHQRELDETRIILENFGNELRYVSFYGRDSYLRFLELLSEFLAAMPKLRVLNITEATDDTSRSQVDFDPASLPNLDNLEVLRVTGWLPNISNVLLAKYGTQLGKLSLYNYRGRTYGSPSQLFSEIRLSPLINLKHLELPEMNTTTCVQSYLNPSMDWPPTLETLFVSVDTSGYDRFEMFRDTFTELLIALGNCFGTCENLHTLNVKLRGWWEIDIFTSPRPLSLPCLKRIWIDSWTPFESIDFILGVSETLKEFILNVTTTDEHNFFKSSIHKGKYIRSRIQFARFEGRMQDSNVWEQMPKLDHIELRCGYWAQLKARHFYRNRKE